MSGLIVKFGDRGFWVKRIYDIWLYHLGYLIKQSSDMPAWANDWADLWLEMVPQGLPEYMYSHALDDLNSDDHIELILDLTRKLTIRLNGYDKFIEKEKQKWISQGYPLQRTRKLINQGPYQRLEPLNHWEMVHQHTIEALSSLKVFGHLFIRLISGKDWNRAYFHSYSSPFRVAYIDFLESVIPSGEVGLSSIKGYERYKGIRLFWVSAENTNAYIDWQDDSVGHHYCIGMPDLIISSSMITEEEEHQELISMIESGLSEQWFIDIEKRNILLLSSRNGGFSQLIRLENDFHSPALKRDVNLESVHGAYT